MSRTVLISLLFSIIFLAGCFSNHNLDTHVTRSTENSAEGVTGDSGLLKTNGMQYVDVAWRLPTSGPPCHFTGLVMIPVNVTLEEATLYVTDAADPTAAPRPSPAAIGSVAPGMKEYVVSVQAGNVGFNRTQATPSLGSGPSGETTDSVGDTESASHGYLGIFNATSFKEPILHSLVLVDKPTRLSFQVKWENCFASWRAGTFSSSNEAFPASFTGGTSAIAAGPWIADGASWQTNLPPHNASELRYLTYGPPPGTTQGSATIDTGHSKLETSRGRFNIARDENWTITLHRMVSDSAFDSPIAFAADFQPAPAPGTGPQNTSVVP